MNKYWLAGLALTLAACGQPSAPSSESAPEVDVYATALAVPTRLDADFEKDESRRPDLVLEFLGIAPGMDVLDMFSGGGYYSEIIAHVVGPEGSVVAHSNEAYLGFVGDEFGQRHADSRLPNVSVLMAENDELEFDDGRYDAILMVLSYHDLYFDAPDQGWSRIDVPALLAELYDALEPGGVLGVVDHYAEAGAPRETGNTLHRIDPAIVIEELTAAGFELADQSDVLRNPGDDLTRIVFDPELRGKTDRFVLRFVKPG